HQTHPRPLLIVHGGVYLVDDLMKKLALPVQNKQGLRVTPPEPIGIITGALAGTANKPLLAWAVKKQLPAAGLSLADGGITQATQLAEEMSCVGDANPG
ncbi:acetylglutamate kinase, partial [Plesiomonas shigelloides]|nr:acetylglutamate kinase [Plesiomonas shigelloides]